MPSESTYPQNVWLKGENASPSVQLTLRRRKVNVPHTGFIESNLGTRQMLLVGKATA